MIISFVKEIKDIPTIIAWNKKWRWKLRKNFKSKISTQGKIFSINLSRFYLIAEIDKIPWAINDNYEWSDWRNGLFCGFKVFMSSQNLEIKFFLIFINLLMRCEKRKDVCGIRLYVEKETCARKSLQKWE